MNKHKNLFICISYFLIAQKQVNPNRPYSYHSTLQSTQQKQTKHSSQNKSW